MLSLLALLLTAPAHPCSMSLDPVDLGLPGSVAGPEAVFGSAQDGVLYDADGNVVPTTRKPYAIEWQNGELLVPDAPLAPGEYSVEPCWTGECGGTIEADAGDPGVPPLVPQITIERTRILSGSRADCGPRVPADLVMADSDAPSVIFAEEPFEDLDGAELLGFASLDESGALSWTTTFDGTVFAAAVDAEGEISEWTGPIELRSRGCSTTTGAPLALGALLSALAVRRRSA